MTVHKVRRVVTGLSPAGKSAFVQDGSPPRVITMESFPGNECFLLWSTEETQVVPTSGADPTMAVESMAPGVNGSRFLINRWPPGTEFLVTNVDRSTYVTEHLSKMPGLADTHEDEDLLMHATDTIDYGVVLSGDIYLEQDDGVEVHLSAGDALVINGTRHTWRNRSDVECVMAFVLVGARRTQ